MTANPNIQDKTLAPDVQVKQAGGYRWELLVLLWLAFFLNQADRQIFSVVLPLIKAELALSDADLGLIASALVWTYGLLVPVAGFTGDRISRKSIIGFSLLFWSFSTLATGLCSTLIQFLVLRGFATGGGEAFYAPSANAMLSERYAGNRSTALALHQTAVYAGIILSGLIAGYIGEHYGWRNAFFVFGAFGIVLAFVIFFRLSKDRPVVAEQGVSIAATAKVILRKPTFLLLTGAFACMVFVNVGYLTWMPSFLVEKFGLSLTDAGFSSMFYHHAGAFLGVLAGGKIADATAKINRRNRLLVQCAGLLLGAPFIYWMAAGHTLVVIYTALFLFGVFRGVYDSNIFASLYEIAPHNMRSSSSGIMLMGAFLAGAFAPLILGILKPTLGLEASLAWLSASYVLGAALLGLAAYVFFGKDKAYEKSISLN
ncbi:MFS transporter [Chitinophaga sp.]|uniref:MFS transporter n=1 Tax=Chitinophaga sp. TaxID=1869181 RepID=UPI0031DC74BB